MFLSVDMKHNLAYIGAVPYGGIEQVRIHWLLNSIFVAGSVDAFTKYSFDFLFLYQIHVCVPKLWWKVNVMLIFVCLYITVKRYLIIPMTRLSLSVST